jgi:hypothetical protein
MDEVILDILDLVPSCTKKKTVVLNYKQGSLSHVSKDRRELWVILCELWLNLQCMKNVRNCTHTVQQFSFLLFYI